MLIERSSNYIFLASVVCTDIFVPPIKSFIEIV